jgi:hypothetical protein
VCIVSWFASVLLLASNQWAHHLRSRVSFTDTELNIVLYCLELLTDK